MNQRIHLWWMIRVYCMCSRNSVQVETLISQIHRIRKDPQRDNMTFMEMEREFGLKLFFKNGDIYSYTFKQEYITAKSLYSMPTAHSLPLCILEKCMASIRSMTTTHVSFCARIHERRNRLIDIKQIQRFDHKRKK